MALRPYISWLDWIHGLRDDPSPEELCRQARWPIRRVERVFVVHDPARARVFSERLTERAAVCWKWAEGRHSIHARNTCNFAAALDRVAAAVLDSLYEVRADLGDVAGAAGCLRAYARNYSIPLHDGEDLEVIRSALDAYETRNAALEIVGAFGMLEAL